MEIHLSLEPISKENYEEICDLKVSDHQQTYVADNTWSLLESKFNPEYLTRGIKANGQFVGFLMWVPESQNKISIWRFMIDQAHQNKGIGRKALQQALSEIKMTNGLTEIEICYDPNNPVAKEFYQRFGFEEVGLDEDGEDMLAIIRL